MTPEDSKELHFPDQVHAALGSASKLEDFYLILCGLLVAPNAFGFSRAFLLRFDPDSNVFRGKLALGAVTSEEHQGFRSRLHRETARLREQYESARQEMADSRALQALQGLHFHSLWIDVIQGKEQGAALNASFHGVVVPAETLPQESILRRAAAASQAEIYHEETARRPEALASFLHIPAVAGRLVTKRGVHAVIIADCKFEEGEINDEALYHFQWLINHASVTLENVELVEELTGMARRLEEVDNLKSNFLSIVSHEFRTPLTSIVGFVHLLQDEKMGSLSPTQRDLLDRVAQHSSHLQGMVNDLLEIAEVEAGGMVRVHPRAVDPLEALLSVIPKVESRRGQRKIPIEPVLRGAVPPIRADENALKRVYFHLLDNAVKFIRGEGEVRVEFVEKDGLVDIKISDTGVGIPEEHVQRIFDHFYQVDFRLERAHSGLGMGLSVVKILMDAMGGKVGVESRPGSGTTFTLSFPLAAPATNSSECGKIG